MRRELITEEQKIVIENLAKDGHYEALVGFGADMYNQGIIKGTILATAAGVIGVIGGVAVFKIVKVVKTKISKKTEKMEKEDESQ